MWHDFFSSQLFGVIIGALITGGFAYFTMRHQLKHQEEIDAKIYNRDKRNETYLAIISFFQQLLDIEFDRSLHTIDQDFIKEYEQTKAMVYMYASQEIKENFPTFNQCFDNDPITNSYTKSELKDSFNEMLIQIFMELEADKNKEDKLCLKQ